MGIVITTTTLTALLWLLWDTVVLYRHKYGNVLMSIMLGNATIIGGIVGSIAGIDLEYDTSSIILLALVVVATLSAYLYSTLAAMEIGYHMGEKGTS